MPTAAFIAAAAAANRQPVALLAIESVDAIKRAITTKPDWQASTLANINALTEPGRVFMSTDDAEPYSGSYTGVSVPQSIASPYATWVSGGAPQITISGETPVLAVGAHAIGVVIGFSARVTMLDPPGPTNYVYQGNPVVDIYGRRNGGSWTVLKTIKINGSNWHVTGEGGRWVDSSVTLTGLTSGTWDFKFVMLRLEDAYADGTSNGPSGWNCKINLTSYQKTHQTLYLTSGTITTPSVDLGLIPTDPSRLEIDDLIPPGCAITYAAWGSNNNSTWTSLGAVTDGATLNPYRYYYLSAALVSDGVNTPYLDELRVVGGNSQYKYFSTHKDTPIQGALPYIAPGGVSSLSSKIDLSQQATVGELTIKLYWRKEVGDMISNGYLKNKTIICKIGFVGLAEQDYEPYFVGSWYDYQADHEKGIISVKTRNILKRFNRKVPAAEYFLDATGKAFVPAKLYRLSGNIMSVMLILADLLGVPDRYLDRASFTTIGAGARSGPNWNVVRDLRESMNANELLNELSISAGVFLVEGPDGRLTAQLYDDVPTAALVAVLDAKHHKFRQIEGGQKELFTRQTIYYQLLPGKDGGAASDYAKGLVYVNAAAEVAWQEAATKEWMDKWGMSTLAVQLLAQRRDAWFANPLSTVKVENVPPRYWGIKSGQVVAVDNLQFPCPAAQWQGYSSGARFLVMSTTTSDPTSENLSVSFDLMQLGPLSFTIDPDFPTYTPFEFYPAVRNLALSERLVVLPGGSVGTQLDVTFLRPLDFHYGGCAIWARANGGAWEYKGRQDFGGPTEERTFGFTVEDLKTIDVAVLTINAAGQTMPLIEAPTVSKFIYGKTTPPADVTDFYATPVVTGGIRFTWKHISDLDLSEYLIRYSPLTSGASWFGASELLRTAANYANLPVPQTGTYFIKAIDTTGHESVGVDSLVIATVGSSVGLTSHTLITESPSWTGGKYNCYLQSGTLWIANLLGPPPEGVILTDITGRYSVATEIDFGSPKAARVSAKVTWHTVGMGSDFDAVESFDSITGFDGETGQSNVQVIMTTSQTSAAPDFAQPVTAGDYVFQRAVFEIKAFEKLPDQLIIDSCVINIDLHNTVITI